MPGLPIGGYRQPGFGPVAKWSLNGTDLRLVRRAHNLKPDVIAYAMGVSVHRVLQLESQLCTTRVSVVRYLSAVDVASRSAAHSELARRSRDEYDRRRAAAREREQEVRVRKLEARSREQEAKEQRHELEARWREFLAALRRNPAAAVCDYCIQETAEPQPDQVSTEISQLVDLLARGHRVYFDIDDVVAELECRHLATNTGRILRWQQAKGRRAQPRPIYDYSVWCTLSDFGRKILSPPPAE